MSERQVETCFRCGSTDVWWYRNQNVTYCDRCKNQDDDPSVVWRFMWGKPITGAAFVQGLSEAKMVWDETTTVSIRASVDGGVRIVYDHLEDGERVSTSRQVSHADIEGLRRLLRRSDAFGRAVEPDERQ